MIWHQILEIKKLTIYFILLFKHFKWIVIHITEIFHTWLHAPIIAILLQKLVAVKELNTCVPHY